MTDRASALNNQVTPPPPAQRQVRKNRLLRSPVPNNAENAPRCACPLT